ncbi:MAG TPA: acetyl-CoA hydrolase/transferase C-terminal domain-containing protein [Gammaproteobacteria bacterium]|nr:acetyl-CoA hydrolase/transferase C-terminal domain-containing protein [Gammaproteobacteria bacterium]
MTDTGTLLTELDACVDAVIARVGKRIVIGTPLGIGKPNHLLNAFYRRAQADRSLSLKIMTALSLEKPGWHSDLERRFLEPFVQRQFGDYPELDYMQALHAGTLPPNIEISEFYFKSGSLLYNALAQQHYTSTNYTHVARDMLAAGVNVILQMVGKEARADGVHYSFGSNPDVTLDILPGLRAAAYPVAVVAQVNRNMPFMYGDAETGPECFDLIVDNPALEHALFAVPNMAIDPAEHMIGLYASTLIRDGGTLQVGIGSLGDAFVYSTLLRHADNARYREIIDAFDVAARFGEEIGRIGGLDAYTRGLYAGSEMFGDGLLRLYEGGVLKRRVYDHVVLQQLLNDGAIADTVDARTLPALRDAGVVTSPLSEQDVGRLKHFGILHPDVVFERGMVRLTDGGRVIPDLDSPQALAQLNAHGLGKRLNDGLLLHGAFFLGSHWFYRRLRDLPPAERRQFHMTAVSRVNELFGNVKLERLQHRHARFINICMKMTLLGAAVSDALENGQVVSGVGGQYNFVAMAHALKEGRSILMLKSTRTENGRLISNMVWEYGHCTIPRHLRDIVITEYGIADLRGRQDWEVIAALLNITDSRFQDRLMARAKAAGKLPAGYRIPEPFRHNTPERLHGAIGRFQQQGLFPAFPFGTDFTPEELQLGKALTALKARTATVKGKIGILLNLMQPRGRAEYRALLARMQLDAPRTLKEKLLARLVVAALAAS